MNQRNTQQGFAVIEAILILVVAGLIGFTGWFVWHSKQVADDAQNKSRQVSSGTIPATKVSSYEECAKLKGSKILETYPEQCVTPGGQKFTNPDAKLTAGYEGKRINSSKGGFSMIALNGWTIEKDTTYDYLFQYDVSKLVYTSTASLKITSTDASGVGGFVPGIMISINEYNTMLSSGEPFVLNDGAKGFCKSEKTLASESQEISNKEGAWIYKECTVNKSGAKLSASYAYFENNPLDTAAVEWAFKTIRIN